MASWRSPRSYWDVVVIHFPLMIITGIAIFLPYFLPHQKLPLIPCTFLGWTGYPCPFCGFTRSFWAIATGEWAYAFTNCPLAFSVYFTTVVVFVWNFIAAVSGVVLSRGPMLQLKRSSRRKALIIITVLFLLNWGYRLAMGFK